MHHNPPDVNLPYSWYFRHAQPYLALLFYFERLYEASPLSLSAVSEEFKLLNNAGTGKTRMD
jgi:hypothetical protein